MPKITDKRYPMTLADFKQMEAPAIANLFDFASNMPASIYFDSTAVKLSEAEYRTALISSTHFSSEEYLLNSKKSSIDLGLPISVFGYSAPGVVGSLVHRDLSEHETSVPPIALPPYSNVNSSLGVTLRSRRSKRTMTGKALSLQQLSNVLFYGDGITGELDLNPDDSPMLKTASLGEQNNATVRTAPSGGGLFPIHLFLLLRNVEQIQDGLYRYLPHLHALSPVRMLDAESDADVLKRITQFGPNFESNHANVIIFYVYNLYDNSRKYGDMAATFALIEAGAIAQNIHLISTALNLSSCDVGGFEKTPSERFLGLDGLTRQVVHVTVVGQ